MSSYTISSFIFSLVDSYRVRQLNEQVFLTTNDLQTFKSDIQTIVCDVLNVDKTYLYLNSDKHLTSDNFDRINSKVLRLIKGEPLSHILGYKYFWDQKLLVTKDTLIPRADTEVLVEAVLNNIKDESAKLKILDLGTGTGAIALALAGELPNSHVTAVDFSEKALNIAKINAKENNIANIEFIQSDWYQNLKNKKFNIIVSNPPYIDVADLDIDSDVKKYEPAGALFAENNGLADIEIIISQAKDFLEKEGYIYIEHGYTQADAIQGLFKQSSFKHIETIKDLNDKDRCTLAKV